MSTPTGYLAYTTTGNRYHTVERCPSITATDAMVIEVEDWGEIPDDLDHCGHCRRLEGIR